MSNEIETKLMVQPYGNNGQEEIPGQKFIDCIDRVLANMNVGVRASSELNLENSYYDTADQALYRAGIALRVRRTDGETEATIKTRRMCGGGIHVHPEYNVPLSAKPDVPDLGMFPSHIFEGLDVDSIQQALAENMAQNCKRHIWLVAFGDAEIEISYDRVTYRTADGGTVSGQETELELKKGGVDSLQEFCNGLINAVYAERLAVFRPESLSKMHRAAIYAGISKAVLPDDGEWGNPIPENGGSSLKSRITALLSVISRAAGVLYLGSAGRSDDVAQKALDQVLGSIGAVIGLTSGDCGDCREFAALGKILEEGASSVLKRGSDGTVTFPGSFAERAEVLDRILTDRAFIREILKINFAGLKGEKA